MGILNVTPDSFSDGGQFATLQSALAQARQLLDEGADILDVGAESTRPGAQPVSAHDEWLRLQDVLTELVRWDVPISLDTMKAEVMQRGVDLGVDILNDVGGFRSQKTRDVLAACNAGAVIMHMQGEPRSMQQAPDYEDCVDQVSQFFRQRLRELSESGVEDQRLLVDPGFGFGKNLQHNCELFQAIPAFAGFASGVLVGVSRKSMIGHLTGRSDPKDRIHGSVAAAVRATQLGARVLRVHDVAATLDALAVTDSLSK